MRYLIDTNGWIGYLDGRPNYGKQAKELITHFSSDCCTSIASIWEAAIKVGIGKLKLPYDLESDLPRILDDCGIELLPVDYLDAVAVERLEPIHGDPFDRIQVVQARRLNLEIISSDPVFDQYGLKRHW